MVNERSAGRQLDESDVARLARRLTALWAVGAVLLVGVVYLVVFRQPSNRDWPDTGLEERLIVAVRDVSKQVADIGAAVTQLRSERASIGETPLPRTPTDVATLDKAIEKLAEIIEALEVSSRMAPDRSAVVLARQRHPEAKTGDVAALVTSLRQDKSNERSWWLLGMTQVIERLGTPNNIVDNSTANNGRVQLWEYFDSSGAIVLTVIFNDGLVTRLST